MHANIAAARTFAVWVHIVPCKKKSFTSCSSRCNGITNPWQLSHTASSLCMHVPCIRTVHIPSTAPVRKNRTVCNREIWCRAVRVSSDHHAMVPLFRHQYSLVGRFQLYAQLLVQDVTSRASIPCKTCNRAGGAKTMTTSCHEGQGSKRLVAVAQMTSTGKVVRRKVSREYCQQ